MTTDNETDKNLSERAERVADLEATYQTLTDFCVQMEFRGSSLTGAIAIMLFELAMARGLSAEEGLRDIAAIWDRLFEAEQLFQMLREEVH